MPVRAFYEKFTPALSRTAGSRERSYSVLMIYQRGGFAVEGVSKDYRRVDGVVFDALMMAKFKR